MNFQRGVLVFVMLGLLVVFPCVSYAEEDGGYMVSLKEFYEDYFAGTQFFNEVFYGIPLRHDERTDKDEYNALENRIHFETMHYPDYVPLLSDLGTEIRYAGDVTVDVYEEAVRYETRELNVFLRPSSWMDLKVGRQILTWGTGDYLFINDMFAKDYVSFLIGRDDEYLKKPQDAVRMTFFSDIVNIDAVFLPWFTPNTIPTGDRISFYDSYKGGITGELSERFLHEPGHQFNNSEQAVRLYRNIGRYETAGYFFNGWYKNPRGYKNNTDELYYPPVTVYGGSVRGPLVSGIANVEVGYLDSRDDRSGKDRMIENSMFKYLLGYSQGFQHDMTVGFQYYLEQILDYEEHKKSLVSGDYKRDHFRQLFTVFYRQDFLHQTVHLRTFVYYSPTDEDVYVRPAITYDVNDRFKITCGGNIFFGTKDFTEFGQYEENTNFYVRCRYSM